MSFGFSIGDFALLVKLAHDTFRACREAGAEYNQIASEVRYLHIVLRILRDDEKSSDSKILRQGSSTTAQLGEIVDGAEERMGATVSSLSLSTYAGDEKTVWQDFRRTLIARGYTSESLERNKDVLLAYMMRLDQ
ncbi:hypothetical protein NA56DRAFT_556836, partial [Hyaloscypha hepaticicola]